MTNRRRHLPSKPPEPPPGYMWWYWDLVPIAHVERRAQTLIASFDRLPRETRNAINYRSSVRRIPARSMKEKGRK
jgi:hypothetical protein